MTTKREIVCLIQLATLALLIDACVSLPDPAALKVAAARVLPFAAPVVGNDDALFVGAGDIAMAGQLSAAAQTAAIIERLPQAIVFTLGDNAYRFGRTIEFDRNYAPTWGAFRDRTWPSPGNHDYYTRGAAGYFGYFGSRAGPPGLGYYSYDVKGWHVISLNSHHVDDPAQLQWLENDLRQTSKPCIVAYWHNPLFSSGSEHGDQAGDPGRRSDRFWRLLIEHHADVVLNGHDHNYERFDPQDVNGLPASEGLREFVVGTGGANLRTMGTRKRNSAVFDAAHHGVLLMTLHPDSYEWRFLATDGTVVDQSSSPVACHAKQF
jgi:hypothetical protein